MLFGTVGGALGVLASIDATLYQLLKRVEQTLARVVKGVGGLEHAPWRRFRAAHKSVDAHGIVDGDLLQLFGELPPASQAAVAADVELTVSQLAALLEQLSQATI